MSKDIRTNVIVSAQTKGFDTAQQKATKFTTTAVSGADKQAKGFNEAQKSSEAFLKELERINKLSFNDAQKRMGGLKKQISSLYKEQMALTSAMGSMDEKASPAYSKLGQQLRDVVGDTKWAEREVHLLTKAFSKQAKAATSAASASAKAGEAASKSAQQQRKGAFVQGLAQGGLPFPAPFLQRGPGMGRQVAGMAIGRGIMGGVRGGQAMAQVGMGGVQGMAAGMSAIPIVGGALAGQFTAAAGYAQQNMQWQRTRLEQAPYMIGYGELMERKRARGARNAKYQKAQQKAQAKQQSYDEMADEAQLYRETINQRKVEKEAAKRMKAAEKEGTMAHVKEWASQKMDAIQEGAGEYWDRGKTYLSKIISGDASLGSAMVEERDEAILANRKLTNKKGKLLTEKQLRKKLKSLDPRMKTASKEMRDANEVYQKAERKSAKAGSKALFGDLTSQGLSLMGVSKDEAARFGGMMKQVGGGREREAQEQGIISAGMAAKTMYGVGAETSGAFLGAGRRGGMVGARGQAGEAFKNTLSEGLQMGLQGSELNKWMQQTAQGIQQFESTGIPINPTSISKMAGGMGGAGITGTRALSMSQGLGAGLQGLGQRGIQSGVDHVMLQIFGGYKGGGAKDYRAARSRLEEMDFSQGIGGMSEDAGLMERLGQFMKHGGGDLASQTEILQRSLEKYGVRGSIKEFDWLGRKAAGEEATPEQLMAITEEQKRRASGADELAAIKGPEGKGTFEKAAKKTVTELGWGAKSQASLVNQQISTGAAMVGTVVKLEQASIRTTKAFNNLAGDAIDRAATALIGLAKKATDAAEMYAGTIGQSTEPE